MYCGNEHVHTMLNFTLYNNTLKLLDNSNLENINVIYYNLVKVKKIHNNLHYSCIK